MTNAQEARHLSQQTRKFMATDDYVYCRLDTLIRRATSPYGHGMFHVEFEETPECFFEAHPSEVKKELMKLGYTVEVSKITKVYYGKRFTLNRYYLTW